MALVIVIYLIRKALMQPLESGVYSQTFKVLEVKENHIILKGTTKIVVYNQGFDLIPGDQIDATIKVKGLLKASYTGDFNEETYYLSKGVTNKGSILYFEKLNHQFKIEELRYSILNFYRTTLGTKSYQYISSIIFGVVELDKDIKEAYQTLYSSHILAISGLHIIFIYQIIKKLLQKVFKIEGEILSLLVVGIYLVLIGFPVAALRAFLFLILRVLNKGKIKYTELDILSLSFILMILMNPFWAFQNGFILSFLISFLLLFMNEFNVYHGVLKKFYTSLLCILATLPFVINQNYEISIT
ncbi:MAG: ComEC/Rec2 family competence protein, partial [Anaeroplasmataceae bacterium]|nr:ComEC/Rec2 family competence protein [Anaeroplasmataceae bacterium]